MEAKDLRVGNLVIGRIGIPVEVGVHALVKLQEGEPGYDPIPLTSDWLFKLGFEDNGLSFSNCNIYERDDLRILVNRAHKDFAFTHKNISPPSLSMRTVKYVHELQNIVFAITGKEFEVKA